jgi:hypothetical protein
MAILHRPPLSERLVAKALAWNLPRQAPGQHLTPRLVRGKVGAAFIISLNEVDARS